MDRFIALLIINYLAGSRVDLSVLATDLGGEHGPRDVGVQGELPAVLLARRHAAVVVLQPWYLAQHCAGK